MPKHDGAVTPATQDAAVTVVVMLVPENVAVVLQQ